MTSGEISFADGLYILRFRPIMGHHVAGPESVTWTRKVEKKIGWVCGVRPQDLRHSTHPPHHIGYEKFLTIRGQIGDLGKNCHDLAASRISSKRGDLGKTVMTLSLSIRLEFYKKVAKIARIVVSCVSISELKEETMTRGTSYKFAY